MAINVNAIQDTSVQRWDILWRLKQLKQQRMQPEQTQIQPMSIEWFYEYWTKPALERLGSAIKWVWEIWTEIVWWTIQAWKDIKNIATWQEVWQDAWIIWRTKERFWTALKESTEAVDAQYEWEQTVKRTILQWLWLWAWATSETIWDIFISTLKTVAPKELEDATKEAIQYWLTETETWQKLINILQGIQQDYETLQNIDPNQARDWKAKYGWLMLAWDIAWLGWVSKGKAPIQQWVKNIWTWLTKVWEWLTTTTQWIKKWISLAWKSASEQKATILQSLKGWVKELKTWAKEVFWKWWDSIEIAQKKAFKSMNPTINKLSKDRNLWILKSKADRANEVILEKGYKPTDTSTRVDFHSKAMKETWDDVDKVLKSSWIDDTIDFKKVWQVIDDYLTKNPALKDLAPNDYAKLKKLAEEYIALWSKDMMYAENAKQIINWLVKNWSEWEKLSEAVSSWLRKASRELWKLMDEKLDAIPWQLKQLKKDYWALAETYEDVIKANIVNQRKKGLWLYESYSRLEWFWDIIEWALWIFSKPETTLPVVWKWIAKIFLWKQLQKLKDPDILTKDAFETLSKTITKKAPVESSIISWQTKKWVNMALKQEIPKPITPLKPTVKTKNVWKVKPETKVVPKQTKPTTKPTTKKWFDNKWAYVNPWQVVKDIKTTISKLNTKNIATIAWNIAKQLWVNVKKVVPLLKWYV